MTVPIGLEGKAYRNTGTYGSPSWNECVNIKNLTLQLEKGEADVSRRGSGGWAAVRGTLKKFQADVEMVWENTDADAAAFLDAFLNNTTIEVLLLDGAVGTAGSEGIRATCEVMNFNRTENLEDGMMVNFTLKAGWSDNPPAWYTAS